MYRIIGADGREYGPISRETLLQWIAEGRANAQTRVRFEGATDWQLLGVLPEFAEIFGASAAKPPPIRPVAPIGPILVRRTNSLATASLVMGLLSVTLGCCCCYGFPFNVLGLVFALIALNQINRAPEVEEGRALAVTGLVLSLVSLAFSVILGMFGFLASIPDFTRGFRHWRV
jgi:hypothetical protein